VRFVILLPADDSCQAQLRELGQERSVYEQAREMIGDLAEIVRAGGLHYLAPALWPVMLVDNNGHRKSLPLNRRAGQLYGGPVAGDSVLCRGRWRDRGEGYLEGFTRVEADQLQALLPP
jgi:hypothetical protein